MKLGVAIGRPLSVQNSTNLVDTFIAHARRVAEAGVRTLWLGQMYHYDSITMAAVVGQTVPDVTVGVSVIPINPRHPIEVSAAAQTAQAATHGRFQLGLGLGAPVIEGPSYGLHVDKPIRRLREYLITLRQLLDAGTADFHGQTLTVAPQFTTSQPGGENIPVLVAAMAPQALRATGELADGTIPLPAGPRALGQEVVPVISAAAERAGRPRPRVIAGVAVVVTSEPERVRALAIEDMAFYENIPSYRKVLDAEGVQHTGELAIIGDEQHVATELQRYFDAGATEVFASHTELGGPQDEARTLALLGELSRGN
ncbi:TIGR03564 family F420-dependent LLM class oxidoreductase [Mycobacteroides abscessus]|nr:TIGR03564 family F420-dependent LLM class oxidoreductase [Mycobacteroides abscessus]MDM2175707.1 TIGR03564 family F420-dependent LLM class oxidoreductase [Mycobacteroides abscessus]MDM2206168.1 TIGR03564 family F420-dependent LLM class oxidoreductase [Mycobacteroides abscessus]MDM2214303.1 TIGR03564 family F420-dependent LLM class oxidoreductase [Mycobacteroides abscessus]MDM2219392.1 TIGR03564 family F420-dependent LLM class oxidoreductase [Mycobacteroides abscessus]